MANGIKLPEVSATKAGILTTGSQTIAGSKTFSGAVLIADGSVTAPSLALSSDSDGSGTGLYRVGANNLGFAANGVAVGDVSADGRWLMGPASGLTTSHAIRSGVAANTPVLDIVKVGGAGQASIRFNPGSPTDGGDFLIAGSGGYNFKNSSNVVILSNTDVGVWTIGTSGAQTNRHSIQGNVSATGTQASDSMFKIVNNSVTNPSGLRVQVNTTGGSVLSLFAVDGSTNVGSVDGSGLWTLGASGGSSTHVVNGKINTTQGIQVNGGDLIDAYDTGTFTPTISSTTNVTATSSIAFRYQRIGRVVHVWGGMDINPTATGHIAFRMTVPVTATATIGDNDARGTGVEGDGGSTGTRYMVRGGANTTEVIVQGYATSTGLKNTSFHYSYALNTL